MKDLIVRLHYPSGHGKLRLRTELDWDVDLEPEDVSGSTTCFRVATERHHLAFKPVLLNGSGRAWAQGANLRWFHQDQPLNIYPYFGSDNHCSACLLRELASAYPVLSRQRLAERQLRSHSMHAPFANA